MPRYADLKWNEEAGVTKDHVQSVKLYVYFFHLIIKKIRLFDEFLWKKFDHNSFSFKENTRKRLNSSFKLT